MNKPKLVYSSVDDALSLIEHDSLNHGGGSGTSGGVTDDWKASVDQQLGQLHGDIRNLLTGVIAGFLFVIAGGAALYASLAGQIADTRKDIAAIQVEQARTSGKLDLLLERTAPKNK